MHQNILAFRNATAQQRMGVAAAALAERHGLDAPGLTPLTHDPQVAALFQREAIAEFLEALLAAEPPVVDSAPNTSVPARGRVREPVA